MTTWFDVPEAAGRFHIIELPFAATSSFRRVAHHGPAAMREASAQIDLQLIDGRCPADAGLSAERLSVSAMHDRAATAMDALRAGHGDAAAVIQPCNHVDALLEAAVSAAVGRHQRPMVIGGDHGSVFGAFAAASAAYDELGLLQIDAHADLRKAYEGLPHSHASIMQRALDNTPLAGLVQVGVRDLCAEELQRIRSDDRITCFFDETLAFERLDGDLWSHQVARIVEALPEKVWISFDIDGLDPSLCPGTGTPVPGGLSWTMACALIDAVGRSGRQLVGADLCEVAGTPTDAIIGSRLAYRLLAAML